MKVSLDRCQNIFILICKTNGFLTVCNNCNVCYVIALIRNGRKNLHFFIYIYIYIHFYIYIYYIHFIYIFLSILSILFFSSHLETLLFLWLQLLFALCGFFSSSFLLCWQLMPFILLLFYLSIQMCITSA